MSYHQHFLLDRFADIQRFMFQRRDGVAVDVSNMSSVPSFGQKAKMVEVTWLPQAHEIGDHIISANVHDTLGYESVLKF